MTGHQDWLNGILYIVAQVIGSFLGGIAVKIAYSHDHTKQYSGTYPNGIYIKNHWWKSVFIEFFATFFLVFVVFATAVDKRASKSVYGMAIGASVTMSAFGIASLGLTMNPCRWLGPAVIDWNGNDDHNYGSHIWASIQLHNFYLLIVDFALGKFFKFFVIFTNTLLQVFS